MSNIGINAIQWSPRIAPEKIRRLYESEACGLPDEELLNDILIGIYLRCYSIMTATEAAYGRVECPYCGAIIYRPENSEKAYELQCPTCPWLITWGEYFSSYQHKQLFWGGAFPAIWEYMDGFYTAQTSRDKFMLIDRLIHAFHWEMINFRGRPVATLVIDGREGTVVDLIENLAYGEKSSPEIVAMREDWQRRRRRTDFTFATWKNDSRDEYVRGCRESETFAQRHRELRKQLLGG